VPNLLKPPKTLTGPLPVQIAQASAYVLDELAAGLTLAASGFKTVHRYPPFYDENRDAAQPSVIISLLNEERPPIWEQVSDWMDRNGPLANSGLCQIAGGDTLKASKVLKR
jgi:ATP-dependent DNA helicase RecG